MSWLRRRWWVFAIVLGLVGVGALLNYVVFPVGSQSPSEAVLEEIREKADGGSARVLIEEPWGDGELVLAHYESGEEGHLGLGFAIRRGRGWKVTAYTEQAAEPDDVTVGSLLVATSGGGRGQPAWAAAV